MISVALPNRYLVAVSDTATIGAGTVWSYFQWTNTRTQGGVGGGGVVSGRLSDAGRRRRRALHRRQPVLRRQHRRPRLRLDVDLRGAQERAARRLAGRWRSSTRVAVNGGGGPYTPQGVDNFDSGTDEGYVIGVDNLAFGQLMLRRVSNPGGRSEPVGQRADHRADDRLPVSVPHPGGTLPLDAIDDRLLQAVMRNGRLWTTHQIEVNGSGVAAVGRRTQRRPLVRTAEPRRRRRRSCSRARSSTPAAANPASYWFGRDHAERPGARRPRHDAPPAPVTRVNAAVTGRLAGDPLGAMNGAPVVYSPNTSFAYNVQSGARHPPALGRLLLHERRSRRRHDALDAAAVRGRHQLVRRAAGAPAGAAAGGAGVGVAQHVVEYPGRRHAHRHRRRRPSGSGFFDPGAGFVRRLTAAFSGAGVTVTNVAFTSPTSLTLTRQHDRRRRRRAHAHRHQSRRPDGAARLGTDDLLDSQQPAGGGERQPHHALRRGAERAGAGGARQRQRSGRRSRSPRSWSASRRAGRSR